MTTGGVQRIYIGGIDPQRLSIDDVSSRLRRLVDVVSIETPANKPSDDCFVNTGPRFFYLNARCPSDDDDDDATPSASAAIKPSPLQVLSKAYNNVKWKGCTLRVEEARPHFLDRLQLEREERNMRAKEEKDDSPLQSENTKSDGTEENGGSHNEATTNPACPPRNLRIRRRHGEEAFRVDTKPIDVATTTDYETSANGSNKWNNRGGSHNSNTKRSASETQWENFGTALDKLRRKRAKHAEQYEQQKRRLKRQAKGRGPKGGVDTDAAVEDVGSLNGKVFLNRAIHVRFPEDTEIDASVAGTKPSKPKDENNAANNNIDDVERVEESSLNVGSSVASSDSDSSDDSIMKNENANKGYAWSDDEDQSDDGEADEDSEEGNQDDGEDDDDSSVEMSDGPKTKTAQTKEVHVAKPKPLTASSGYAWSDDDDSDDESSDDEAPHQANGAPRGMGRSFSSLKPVDYDKSDGCKECSNPTEYDEFSSAFDFAGGDIADEGQDEDGDEVHFANDAPEGGYQDYQLDNDVSSNLNVLGQLFPDMASIKPNKSNIPGDDDNEEEGSRGDGSLPKPARPGWGITGLMQRYDPNDSKSAKFEVDVSERSQEKTKEVIGNYTKGKEKDADLGSDDGDKEIYSKSDGESSDSASTSSEESDDDDIKSKEDTDGENINISDDAMEAERQMSPEKQDVYEQDKLEGIFQEARSGEASSGGFQMSQLFGDLRNTSEAIHQDTGAKTSSASGFSFGFDVGDGDEKAEAKPSNEATNGDTAASGFSFSFDVSSVSAVQNTDVNNSSATDTSLVALPNKDPEVTLKRRRGFLFPEDVLDDLEQSFFHMNEGKRILEDYEAMKADLESQNSWQEERKTLTLDWKRKQKFAMTRKQKRRK